MKPRSLILIFVGLFLAWSPAHAYIGPGGGLTAIGALLALVACIAVAFLGFLWYPVKRILRKRREAAGTSLPKETPPVER